MKKLVLLLAVVFSVSLFSCGGAAKTEAAADTTEATVDTCCQADTCVADSCCQADSCVADSVK